MNAILNQIRRIAPRSAKQWFRVRRKQKAMAQFASNNFNPLQLYVGCGNVHIAGWVHLDRDAKAEPDLVWDVAWGLPLAGDTADVIYSEHFLEHLPLDLAVNFLSECFRCLRTAMPSLDVLLDLRSSFEF